MSYRPLPDFVELRQSDIDGIGLFAKTFIPKYTLLGWTHISTDDPEFENGFIRTPLGGFINHSDEPNLFKTTAITFNPRREKVRVWALRDILQDEELTLRYTLYNIFSA